MPGGRGPSQDASRQLFDGPVRAMFQMMMRRAQVREIVVRCVSIEQPVAGVIQIAVASSPTASGESTRHITHPQPGLEIGRRSVSIPAHGKHGTRLGMSENPDETGSRRREIQRRVVVNRTVALKGGGFVD